MRSLDNRGISGVKLADRVLLGVAHRVHGSLMDRSELVLGVRLIIGGCNAGFCLS